MHVLPGLHIFQYNQNMIQTSKKMMVLLAIVGLFCATFAHAQFRNRQDFVDSDKHYNQALEILERLELNSPRSAADLVKMREAIEALYTSSKLAVSARDANFQPSYSMQVAPSRSRAKRKDWRGVYEKLQGKRNGGLKHELQKEISCNKPLDYTDSRRHVMLTVDKKGRFIECIYTGKIIDASKMPDTKVMNIEHSWPQSKGAKGVAKADLHHLFPTDPVANSTRSSLPFGIVDDPRWAQGGSECDLKRFEVRKKYRGNIARALFYFSTRYGKSISAQEEDVLRQWHKEDPVDADESARNDKVENIQGNRNPFIDRPDFVNNIADF